MNSDIRKYVSRYVVPFYYDHENSGYENYGSILQVTILTIKH